MIAWRIIIGAELAKLGPYLIKKILSMGDLIRKIVNLISESCLDSSMLPH
jgi:hypothetical protein